MEEGGIGRREREGRTTCPVEFYYALIYYDAGENNRRQYDVTTPCTVLVKCTLFCLVEDDMGFMGSARRPPNDVSSSLTSRFTAAAASFIRCTDAAADGVVVMEIVDVTCWFDPSPDVLSVVLIASTHQTKLRLTNARQRRRHFVNFDPTTALLSALLLYH